LRTVNKTAAVDEQKCTACRICVRLCPVEAITIEKRGDKRVAVVEDNGCYDCKLCFTRCPEYAITMVERAVPLQIGTALEGVSEDEVARICRVAHMYPDQVVCYCHRVQAKEVVAAILKGAKTPEDIARDTGARTGCGVLCITGVIRLLKAAGIKLTKAPGYQWYDLKLSLWDIPPEMQQKYPQYYLAEDLRDVDNVFPGGEPH